jgi:exodeoxyribonuclease V alpha subunit
MDTLSGTVERITFFNEENGYCVLKLMPEGKVSPDSVARDGTVTVVGVMPELGVGEAVQFGGTWNNDPKWGRQFRVEMVTPITPTSIKGITNYLASGIVKGIGERTAQKIVDHFGAATLDILDKEPHRLEEVRGLKKDLAKKLSKAWAENVAVRQTMIFLQGYGVSSRMSNRIYQQYGSETIKVVKDDPYTLADEVFGIGFIKADAIARNMGIEPDAHIRLRAGLHYALNKMSMEGHTYMPRAELVETAGELLQTDNLSRIEEVLAKQLFSGELINDTLPGKVDAVYLPMYFNSERGAARRLNLIANTTSKIIEGTKNTDWKKFLADLAQRNNVTLTPQQQGAVKAALTSKLSVLTGGPGTGKTTTLQMVIRALEEKGFKYALASPTGRAAKRLSEATERPASTIHRLLGYGPSEGFLFDEDSPLEVDILIVDEASMIDLVLFYNLLKALPNETHLMLVGDVDQLPSVGAGNVLRDVIDSDIASVTRLKTIFRQSDDSYIVVNAHRINDGEMPFTDNRSADFFFFGENEPTNVSDLIVDIVTSRLPDKFNYDPMNDIQVIAPMYRGPAGVTALNDALQQALNGDRRMAEKQLYGRVFRVGDKVMQTKNNYEKDVFNGDIGRIYGIDLDENYLEVLMDGRYIEYEFGETDELMHAYCISTHRSQGSEYPVVVMPILTQHYMMLQRNLLYTAITRAKQAVVLVGNRQAIYMAVQNNKVAERYSGLLARLSG